MIWLEHLAVSLPGQVSGAVNEEMEKLLEKVATLQQDKWKLEERVRVVRG